MRIFITLSKRNLAVILAVMIIAIIVISQTLSQKALRIDGSTNALRKDYLSGIKLNVDDSAVSSKEITIPLKFNDIYKEYNTLQKKAGFDLSRHKGKKALLYTYKLNGDFSVHLIVCKGEVIGGDIASNKYGGKMKPLK